MPDPLRRLGDVSPAARAIAAEVLDYLESIGQPLPDHPETGDQVIWGIGGSSEHATGRALDFMVTADPDVGELIADYVWRHRDRLDLVHVIWRQRIRSTVESPGVWRAMDDRGSPTEKHRDHPHVYLGVNAAARRAGGAQTVTAAPPKPRPAAPPFPLPRGWYFGPRTGPVSSVSGYYSHRAGLRRWQARMAARGWTLTADGLSGPETARVARAFQREKGLAVDGLIGPATWRAAWTEPIT